MALPKIPPGPRAWGPLPGQPHGTPGQGVAKYLKQHPKKPAVPGAPRRVVVQPPPEDPVMTMFRTTLQQIRSSASPVDEAAISAPYRASMDVATGLGQGAATASQANTQKVSDMYAKASGEAKAQAMSYGIGAGGTAEANQAAPDNTQALLAQQSQAQQNAAVGAGTAWAQLLERTRAAAVNRANLTRQAGIDQASESLAASIPSMYQSRDQLALQAKTAAANNQYLYASLDAAGKRAFLQAETTRRGQDIGAENTAATVAGAKSRSDASIAAANKRNTANINAANQRNTATIKGAQTRASVKAKSGVKGITQVMQAITPKATSGPRTILGYTVTYHADPNGIIAGAGDQTQFVDDPATAAPPPGYLAPGKGSIGVPKYAPAGQNVPGGVTLAGWNKGVGILMTANGWTKAQAMQAMQNITPRPPK